MPFSQSPRKIEFRFPRHNQPKPTAKRRTLALCLTALFLSTPCVLSAQTKDTPLPDMSAVEQAWEQQDFDFVRSALKRMAKETDVAFVQYRYGRVLLEGHGGPTDIDAAVQWLQKAVDQNHAQAAALLARIYLSEFDQDEPLKTQRDPERAATLLHLSAALGFAEGQYQLARLHSAGLGLTQDPTTAFRWYLAAARQQHPKAQLALAQAYSKGVGTGQDPAQAIHWLSQAAGSNNTRAQISLARAYETGNGVSKSLPRAMDWYEQAAQNGLVLAQRQLGIHLLAGGDGVPQDVPAALRWIQQAASAGDPDAMAILGRTYFTGSGVAQSIDQAAFWYGRAAQYDHGRAKVALGAMHETGRGVAQDMDAALTLYQSALSIKDGNRAAIRLGQLAANGALKDRFAPERMVPWVLAAMQDTRAPFPRAEHWLKNQAKAGLRAAQSGLADLYLAHPDTATAGIELLHLAANAGDIEAQHRLGLMYMIGDQVDVNYVAAHNWFNIAATLGHSEATNLRATASSLMTSDQVADAQDQTRLWFSTIEPQPPTNDQTITMIKP